jgi:hypothetical protein
MVRRGIVDTQFSKRCEGTRGSFLGRILAVASLALAVTFGIYGQARAATKTLTTIMAAQPDSPVRIIACSAYLGNSNGSFAFEWPSDRGLEDFTSHELVTFKNLTAQTVQAVEFRLKTFDISGGPLDIISLIAHGTFSPGIEIRKGPFDQFNPHGQALDKIVCSVERVRFANGSVWSSGDLVWSDLRTTRRSDSKSGASANPATCPHVYALVRCTGYVTHSAGGRA